MMMIWFIWFSSRIEFMNERICIYVEILRVKMEEIEGRGGERKG